MIERRRWLLAGGAVATLTLAGCQTTPKPAPVVAAPPPPVEPPPKPIPTPPRIGLALGGGAARGFAHIGVIQVLEENGIKPDLVAGTSAGSLVAALYASGKSGAELAALADSMDESAFTDWSFPGRGLIRGEGLAKYVRDHTGGLRIEQMRVPLGIVATDLDNGEAILFQRGDPGVAVRASSAVPAVFQPVRIGLREYVDGGLVAPVPVRFAREMGAEFVIAVNISSHPDTQAAGSSVEVMLQTFNIMGQSISRQELKEADVVIQPSLGAMKGSDFGSRNIAILAGEQAAAAVMAELKQKLKVRRDQGVPQ